MRHHHHMIDQPERVDHRIDQHEQRRRHQQRQRDAAEEGPARRAFKGGAFLQVRRHRLEGGEVEDHEKPRLLPHRDHDHRSQRGLPVAEPVVPPAAEPAEDVVEQPVIRREEEQPDIGDRDHRQHRRREIRHAHQSPPRNGSVDGESHHQRQDHRGRNGPQRIDRVVAQRRPEHGVGYQVGVVLDPDEARRAAALGRGIEAVEQRRRRRPVGKRHQQQQRRHDQQPALDRLPPQQISLSCRA